MKNIFYIQVWLSALLFSDTVWSQSSKISALANDQCANAELICRGITNNSTNVGANATGDPATSCGDAVNNGVWYVVNTFASGDFKVSLSNYTGDMTIEIFDGAAGCGSLSTIDCSSGANPISASVAGVDSGEVYYVLVDGVAGNTSTFDIQPSVTSGPNHTIEGVALPLINIVPGSGCVPFTANVDNETPINSSTIDYTWVIYDVGGVFPVFLYGVANSSGQDTTFYFDTEGEYKIELTVSNNCPQSPSSAITIGSQTLTTDFSWTNNPSCMGTPITFNPSSALSPDFPTDDANPTAWSWSFGDPNSGGNNASTDEDAVHTFVGTNQYVPDTFTVTLITTADCGPDTISKEITLRKKPTVNPNGPLDICEGNNPTLIIVPAGGTAPYNPTWTNGGGVITQPGNDTTSVTGLTAGSYTFDIDIADAIGCIADSVVDVDVDARPDVDASIITGTPVCAYDPVQLSAAPTGSAPFDYTWYPAKYLDDPSSQTPIAKVPTAMYIYVYMEDATGCVSDTDSVFIDIYSAPTYNYSTVCESSPLPRTTDVTMLGAGVGSTFEWYLSSNYALISDASGVDSTTVTVDFSGSVAGDYSFIVLATDGVTACVDTIPVTVSLDAGITMSVNGPFSICIGDTVSLSASDPSSYSWVASPADTSLNGQETSNSPDVFPDTTTLYIVTGTTGSCTIKDTVSVTVNSLPIAAAAPSANPICPRDSITITAGGGATYLWSTIPADVSLIGQETDIAPKVSPQASTQYCVQVTDVNACVASACTTVTITLNPDFTSGNDTTVCEGDTVEFTAFGGTTYTWFVLPVDTQISAADSIIVFPSDTTNYYALTPENGCVYSDTVTLNIIAAPPLIITPTNASICKNDSTTLAGSGADTYVWTANPIDPGLTGQDSIANPSLSPSDTTIYSVFGTDTTTGCSITVSETINVFTLPSINVSASEDSICLGDSTTLSASGGSGYVWNATPADVSLAGQETSTNPKVAPGVDTRYCVTGTDLNGCSGQLCYDIVIKTNNDFTIGNDTSMCEGDSMTFNAAGGTTYLWYQLPGNILVSNKDSINVKPSETTSYFAVTSENGCSYNDTATLTVNPDPALTLSSTADTICSGNSVSFTAAGAHTYVWKSNPIDGSLSGKDSIPNPTVNPMFSTIYTVTATDTTTLCSAIKKDTVTVLQSPSVTVAAIDTVCGCDTVNLDGTGSTTAMAYLWTSNNGNITDSSLLVTTAIFCNTDTFNLIVTNPANGCSVNASAEAISNGIPKDTITLDPVEFCEGSLTIINLDGTGSDTTAQPVWTSNPAAIIVDDSALVTTATINDETIFTLTLSRNGCDTSVSDTVIFYPKPTVDANPGSLCIGDNLQDTLTVVGGSAGSTYDWSASVAFATITGYNADTSVAYVDYTLFGSGNYDYTITVDDSVTGCVQDVAFTFVVFPNNITLTVTNDTAICDGDSLLLSAAGAALYVWTATPADAGLTGQDSIPGPKVSPSDTTKYHVTGYAGSCFSNDSVNVKVKPIPNISVGNDTAICVGDNALIKGNGGTSYNWYVLPVDTFIGSGASILVSPTSTTQYYASGSLSGCSNADSIRITVNSLPNVTVNANIDTICSGNQVTLGALGAHIFSWSANPADVTLNGQENNAIVTVSPATNTQYTVIGTDTNTSCTDPSSYNIISFTTPTAIINTKDSICSCETITLDGTGSTTSLVYLWSATLGSILDNDDLITSATTCNKTTYSLIVTDTATSCADTATKVVEELTQPDAVITLTPDSFCPGVSTIVTLDGTGSTIANASYLWESLPVVGITDSSQLVTMATTNQNTIFTLTVSLGGCDSITKNTVRTYLLPSVNASPASLCVLDVLQTTFAINGSANGSVYDWSDSPDLNTVDSFNADSSVANIDYTAFGAGTYNYVIIITDGQSGCIDTLNYSFTVFDNNINLTLNNDTNLCLNDSLQLNISGATEYVWTASPADVGLSGQDSISNPKVSPAITTKYYVTGYAGSCFKNDSVSVTVLSLPTITASNDTTVCSNENNVSLQAIGGIEYNWYILPEDSLIDSIQNTNVTPTLTTTYYVRGFDGSCYDNDSVTVSVKIKPTLNVGSTKDSICEGESLILSVNGANTYTWSSLPSDTSLSGQTTSQTPTVQPDTTTTYTIIGVSTATGCRDTSSKKIVVFSNPISSMTVLDSICGCTVISLDGSNSTLTNTLLTWSSILGSPINDINNTIAFANVCGNDKITLIVLDTISSCSDTSNTDIAFTSKPDADFDFSITSICDGVATDVTLSGTADPGLAYAWTSVPVAAIVDTSSLITTATITTTTQFTLTVTKAGGCDSTITKTLNVYPAPSLTPAPADLCLDDVLKDTLTISGAAPGSNYNWNNSPDFATIDSFSVDTSIAYADFTALGVGQYDFIVIVTDALTGCIDTLMDSIRVYPNNLNLTVSNDTTICNTDTAIISAAGVANYLWSSSPADPSLIGQENDSILIVTPSVTTKYYITGSAGSCTKEDSVLVTVKALPNADAGNDTTICEGSTVEFSVIGTGTYEWYQLPEDTLISTDKTFILSLNESHEYYVNVIGGNGCTNSDTIKVIVDPIPSITSFLSTDTICSNDTAVISSQGGESYLWSANPVDVSLAGQETDSLVNVSPDTTTSYTLIASVGACDVEHNFKITVNVAPTVLLNASDNPACISGGTTITASGANSYVWTSTPIDTTLNGQDSIAVVIVFPAIETQYCVNGTDTKGCSDTSCITISMLPLPTADAGNDTTVCQNDLASLTADGGISYEWYLLPVDSLVGSNQILNYNVSDTSSFFVTATAANGCTDNDTVNVDIVPAPIINLSISDSTICIGDSTIISAGGGDNYAWSSFPADATLSGQENDSVITVFPSATTIYSLYTISDATGCDTTLKITIAVNNLPTVVTKPINDICGCDTVILNGTGSTAGLQFEWSIFNNGVIGDSSKLITNAYLCKTDSFKLLVTNANTGCSDSAIVSVTSKPKPSADASVVPTQFCDGVSTVITLTGVADTGITYLWAASPVAAIVDPNAMSTTAIVSESTTFTFTVTDTNSCDTIINKEAQSFDKPILEATPNSFCTTSPPLDLVLDITGASPASSYDWYAVPVCANPNVIGNVSSQAINFDSCGVDFHTFYVEVTDAVTGCIDTISIDVEIADTVTLNLNLPDTVTICEGDSLFASASGAFNYIWSTGDTLLGDSISTVLISPGISSGTHVIFVDGFTGGCAASDTVVVIVVAIPEANSGGDFDMCFNDTVMLTAADAGVGASYEWYLLFNDSLISNTQNVEIPGDSSLSFYLVVSVSGCVNRDTFDVTVNDLPIVSIDVSADTICQNEEVTLVAIPSGGSSYTYQWNDEDSTQTQTLEVISLSSDFKFCVDVTDINTGCIVTECVDVVTRDLPAVKISGTDTACKGDAITLKAVGAATYKWAKTTQPGVSLGTADTLLVTPAINTCYLVTGTDSNGCKNNDTICIVLHEIPEAFAGTDNEICEGDSLSLSSATANNGTWLWTTTGDGIFSDSSDLNPIYYPGIGDQGDTITLTLTVSNGPCPDTVSNMKLVVGLTPTAIINSATPDTVCSGDDITLDGTVTNGSYVWYTDGNGIFDNNGIATPIYTTAITDAGILTLILFGSGSLACDIVSDSIEVEVKAIPSAEAGPNDIICEGDLHTLWKASASNGSIAWMGSGDGLFSDTSIAKPIYTHGANDIGNTITLTITVSNAPCPQDIDSMRLQVVEAPTVVINSLSDDTICEGETVDLTSSSDNDTGGLLWTDGGLGGSFGTADANNTTYTPATTGLITLYIAATGDTVCLPAIDSVSLVVKGKPQADAGSGYNTLCENSPIILSNATSANGSVLWTTNGLGTFDDDTLTQVTYTPAPGELGTITLTMTVSNPPCADSVSIIDLEIDPAPLADITVVDPNPICEGSKVTVEATATNDFGGVLWSDNTGLGLFTNPSGTVSIYTSNVSGDTVTLYFTVTGTSACLPALDSATLDVKTTPYAQIFGATNDTICQGLSTQIIDSVGNGTIVWTSDGNGIIDPDSTASPIYIADSSEKGNVKLTVQVTNSPCPSASATYTINVVEIPEVYIEATDTTICYNDSTSLIANVNINDVTYIWNDALQQTSDTIFVMPTDTTEYIVAISNPGCTIYDSLIINVIPPGIPAVGLDIEACPNDSAITLTGTVQHASGGVWSTSNGTGTFSPSDSVLNTTYIPSETEKEGSTIEIQLTSIGACYNFTDSLSIIISNPLTINAGGDQSIPMGDEVELTGGISEETSVQWSSTGSGVFVPNDTSVNATYVPSESDYGSGGIMLILSGSGICGNVSDTILIEVEEVLIPNVVTPYPASPGQNDVLYIGGLPGEAGIEIFNKWGRKVYQSDAYRNDWDARNLESGVYYIILTYKEQQWNSYVMIITDEDEN